MYNKQKRPINIRDQEKLYKSPQIFEKNRDKEETHCEIFIFCKFDKQQQTFAISWKIIWFEATIKKNTIKLKANSQQSYKAYLVAWLDLIQVIPIDSYIKLIQPFKGKFVKLASEICEKYFKKGKNKISFKSLAMEKIRRVKDKEIFKLFWQI